MSEVLNKNGARNPGSSKPKKKKQPARVQVDASVLDESERPEQTGNVFNIWYYNWGAKDRFQTKSPYRVNIKRDSGYTKADKVPNSFLCLFFARGCCHKGKNCEYLHRLPNPKIDNFPGTTDCFGRDKFSDYRDDMGGVGNFLKPNKTLYIGQLPVDSVPENKTVEEVLSSNFGEFGRIERMRVIHSKNCAFITFENEWNAQFAKEALAHQSVILDEVLNIRWATEDPDPQAKARAKKQLERDAFETVKAILEQADNKEKESSSQELQKPSKPQKNQRENKRKMAEKQPEVEKKVKTVRPPDTGLITGYESSSDEDD